MGRAADLVVVSSASLLVRGPECASAPGQISLQTETGEKSYDARHHPRKARPRESRSFRDRFRTFNTQIWAYHWLQAAVYDVQLAGGLTTQRELLPKVIDFYHGYLRRPPEQWQYMPMVREAAPEFARRFPEAAAIFDKLHMLHDNFDDVLERPDFYPTRQARRAAILRILPIYLHRSHGARDLYPDFHERPGTVMTDMGPRPPSARDVLR